MLDKSAIWKVQPYNQAHFSVFLKLYCNEEMKLFYTSSIKLLLWTLSNQSTDKLSADENVTILHLRFISNILDCEPFCKYCPIIFYVPILLIFFSIKYNWTRFDVFGLLMENVFIFRIKCLKCWPYTEVIKLCSSKNGYGSFYKFISEVPHILQLRRPTFVHFI